MKRRSAKDGDPSAFLPLIHYTLLVYSHPFSVDLTERGYELYAKSDLRFMEGVYKVSCKAANTACLYACAHVCMCVCL